MSQQMSSTSAQGIPVSIDGAIGVSVEQQQQSSATGPLAELFIDDSIVDVSVHDNVITVNDNLTNTTITPGDSVTPVEAKKWLFSRYARERTRNGQPLQLSFVDVKKAYFMVGRLETST